MQQIFIRDLQEFEKLALHQLQREPLMKAAPALVHHPRGEIYLRVAE
jgi:hypothetical protein